MKNDLKDIVQLAIAEDLGTGDISAELIAKDQLASATIITREDFVLCGQEYADAVFQEVDAKVKIHWHHQDGDCIPASNQLCQIDGSARSILTAERTALNFLQTLSATATYTYKLNQLIKHTKTKLLDTRKTIPGLRVAQKYAVKCGGGENHRMGLYDAFLLKENHIHAAGSITNVVKKARELQKNCLLEVEVENLEQLNEALECNVSRIMLDNFSLENMKKAVAINNGQAELEASGNISEENLVTVAETGVDFISIGKLTKDIKAIDLSLRFS